MSTAERIDELRNRFTENPRRYFASLANELRKAGNAEEAIAICRDILPTLPGHMSGYIVLGQALYELDRIDEARAVFEEALGYDPENLIALRHLGDIDRRRGNAAAARRWYERVLEADPRNDDIAAHLMTLGTPFPAVPQPTLEAPAVMPPAVVTPVAVTPVAVTPVAVTPVFETPMFETPTVVTPVHPVAMPAPVVETRPPLDPAEDPFGFGVPLEEVIAEDVPFEEGLVASSWPDTSALEARRSGERPAVVDGAGQADMATRRHPTPEVLAAFGAEPQELPVPRMPGDGQPWITEPPRKTREVEVIAEAIAEDARASGEPDGVAVFAHPAPEHGDVTPFSDVHPALTPPALTPPAPTPIVPDAVPMEAPMAAPMADVLSLDPLDTAEPPRAPAVDGFATETMGELLASQGLIDQAIGVYEELVRRRPADLSLADRLAALRDQRRAASVAAAGAWRTARERFGALAARSVRRAVPPEARTVVTGPLAPTVQIPAIAEPAPPAAPFPAALAEESAHRSLASLFGSPAPADEAAASTLSGIFTGPPPEPAEGTGTTAWLDALSALPFQTVPEPRAPTPWGATPAIDAPEPTGFDRAFPDAVRPPVEPVVDPQTANDLAEFSAWLKGLGSP